MDEVEGQAGALEALHERTQLTLIATGEGNCVGAFGEVPNTAAVTCRVDELRCLDSPRKVGPHDCVVGPGIAAGRFGPGVNGSSSWRQDRSPYGSVKSGSGTVWPASL